LYLPSRVLFVKVEGNTRVSADKILEVAEICGIRFGASRRRVRSEAIKNNILLQLPELKWAGVNTYGSVATITVRERDEDTFDARNGIVSDIVAVRDGVIDEIIVTRGTTALVPGQSICKGELLISGHSDCDRVVLEHRAEGEVYAFTKQEIQAIYLKPMPKKALKQKQPKNFSVLFGKKLINLRKDSGNLGTGYGKIYKMRYVYLPGGFQLPVGLVCVAYQYEASAADQLPVQTLVQRYIQQNMVAGSILREDIRVQEGNGFTILDCTYFCREMIGKEIVEEILLESEQRS
jgi:sporulation protein YqfD